MSRPSTARPPPPRCGTITITFRDADHIVLREGEEPDGRQSYFARSD